MLVFALALRNPETAHNWDRTHSLCQETVRSVLGQSVPDLRVIVACKDFTPSTSDERLTVIRRPFATPDRNWKAQNTDKKLKIAHCLVEARKFAPCYVMRLDADDLVSSKLASVVQALDYKPGYYIPRGYRWREGSRFIRLLDNFHLVCGSSSILWCEKEDLPASIDDDMANYRIMRFGHQNVVPEFEKMGTPLMPIDARAVIYRVGHGESITSHFTPGTRLARPSGKNLFVSGLRRVRLTRFFTKRVRDEFSIDRA